jgi:hypothetical protein
VPARVSPVEQIRTQIDELFASNQDLGQVLEQVARRPARQVDRRPGGAGAAQAARHHRAVASRLLGKASRTNALESLVLAGFVGGLSVRGRGGRAGRGVRPEAVLSKSTVARICQAIKDEFNAWKLGDLSGIELDCLVCEGSHFQMRCGRRC